MTLTRLTVAAVAVAASLGWATKLPAQVTDQAPRGPTTHTVTVAWDAQANRFAVSPDALEVHRSDWVVWVWNFPTTHAEVYLCSGFRESSGASPRREGPGGRCLEETDEEPAILKTKIRDGAPFGNYKYDVAFTPVDGSPRVLDPELIVKPH